MKLPEWLVLWVRQALIGEIYPAIRAIALGYGVDKELVLRCYLDREPTEEDLECIECVITNIFAHTSSSEQIKNIVVEVVFSEARMDELDVLDGLVYARREQTSSDIDGRPLDSQ